MTHLHPQLQIVQNIMSHQLELYRLIKIAQEIAARGSPIIGTDRLEELQEAVAPFHILGEDDE